MISYYANGSIFGIGRLSDRCCYSKERSYSQKTSNLVFLSIRKRRTVGGMKLVSTNMVILIFVLLLVVLAMTTIVLQSYQLLVYYMQIFDKLSI